ncbi:TauD/TfdA family dioxygenase [Pseudohalioglobus sediminis]|uniref:TauD/TfdA family dioxygenase n=2 Tax=Pseudohalioglobus sediminis TaxID=2606449 RepID=A0A5B0WWN6_9GAMM|nr:TauD/TfdA family dioxygenase [Pseudohalioglobus sediminis]
MGMTIRLSGQAFGATVTGVDLSKQLADSLVTDIRQAWVEHGVLAFPNQSLSDDDLERFTAYFGDFGEDPFVQPIPGRKHIIAIQRKADETSSIFAEAWHTDWSFQSTPPAGTCLYGITIPESGGDTLFANQHMALDEMPSTLRARIEGRYAIHSAAGGYAPEGLYGKADEGSGRSMRVKASEAARDSLLHPLIKVHPESGRESLFGCLGYIVGIEGMEQDAASDLLLELHQWQTSEHFQYRHKWSSNMLVMWDNRSVLHRATGGYEGYDRLLHRTTIGSRP